MLKDNASIKGIVNLVLRDEHGRVKQHKTIRNAVTRDGIAHIIGRMIDTGQDRNGTSTNKHIMPRMMSHMAIGVGDGAVSGQANTSDAEVADTRQRFLQGEVGSRVQLMKDTSRTVDYQAFDNLLPFAVQTDNAAANYNSVTVGDTFFLMATSATTTGTLRVGMLVAAQDWFPTGTYIKQIDNQLNGVTKVHLMDAPVAGADQAILGGPVPALAVGTVADRDITFSSSYVDVIPSLDLGTNSHPYATVLSTPTYPTNLVYSHTDYSTGLRGKLSGYYDTVTTPGNALDNSKRAPFFGEANEKPSADYNQFGTDLDGIFQGSRPAGSGSIVEDSGNAAEGYYPEENDYDARDLTTLNYTQTGAANAIAGSKKIGNRIVFIGTFKENNPNASNTLVREAGIFNAITAHPIYDTTGFTQVDANGVSVTHPGQANTGWSMAAYLANYTIPGAAINKAGGGTVKSFAEGSPRAGKIEQTMLCRTQFDVVTKALLDTLQITWSVQLADQ
jgi:hypothetical protein